MRLLFTLLCLCGFGILSGFSLADDSTPNNQKSPPESNSGATASDSAQNQSPPAKRASNLIELPPGGVPELLEFIRELKSKEPRSRKEFIRIKVALADAAAKILELEKDSTAEAYIIAKTIVLSEQLSGLVVASPDERQRVLAEVESMLQGDKLTRNQISLGALAIRFLEYSDDTATASKFCALLISRLEKSELPNERKMAELYTGLNRRLNLVGKAMELEGETFDHNPFKLKSLHGKVVLIDFWATWCGPCISEIPNMLQFHKAYHEKGFEIVGLSIDDDRDELAAFLEERKLPWIILHDEQHHGQHPAQIYYGVSGIPCMILVGRDGKVLSTQARGEELEKLLEKEFGPLPEAPAKE